MKYTLLVVLTFLLCACSNHVQELQSENEALKFQNDSLIKEIEKYSLYPFLDNTAFEMNPNDTFRTNVLLVQKDGISVDSAIVKGFLRIESEDMLDLIESDIGTMIRFTHGEPGNYEIKAYSRVHLWAEKVVPLMFPVKVKK